MLWRGKKLHYLDAFMYKGRLAWNSFEIDNIHWWNAVHDNEFRQTIERPSAFVSVYMTADVYDLYEDELQVLTAIIEAMTNGRVYKVGLDKRD